MNHDTLGEVWLVGAGCGAADLITVRGLRLIRRCDAIISVHQGEGRMIWQEEAGSRMLIFTPEASRAA